MPVVDFVGVVVVVLGFVDVVVVVGLAWAKTVEARHTIAIEQSQVLIELFFMVFELVLD
jgi:hypothetical protein